MKRQFANKGFSRDKLVGKGKSLSTFHHHHLSFSSSSPFIFFFISIIITHKFRGSEENRQELPRCVFIIALPPVLATSGCLFAAFPCCTLVHSVSDDDDDDDDALPKMIMTTIMMHCRRRSSSLLWCHNCLFTTFPLHFVHFVKKEVS